MQRLLDQAVDPRRYAEHLQVSAPCRARKKKPARRPACKETPLFLRKVLAGIALLPMSYDIAQSRDILELDFALMGVQQPVAMQA